MQENDAKETIDNVDYLIRAAGLLPNESYAHKLMKSHLLTKSRKLLDSCANQQRTLFNDEEVCRKCTTPWSDTNYSIAIESIKLTKCRTKKVMRTVANKSQFKRQLMAKRLSKTANNVINVTCDLCKNRKRIVLWKKASDLYGERPQRPSKAIAVEPTEQSVMILDTMSWDATDLTSKKRKHKKDKTAGLLYTMNKDDKQVQKVVQKKNANIVAVAPKKSGKNKSKGILGGAQKPKVKMTNLMAPSHILKKPSILQLANALKKKNAEPTTTADKLKKMLN